MGALLFRTIQHIPRSRSSPVKTVIPAPYKLPVSEMSHLGFPAGDRRALQPRLDIVYVAMRRLIYGETNDAGMTRPVS